MVNKSQNAPCMTLEIRSKRKNQLDRGALKNDKIKKRIEMFGVEPTAMLERKRTSKEDKRVRTRDRSKSCGG